MPVVAPKVKVVRVGNLGGTGTGNVVGPNSATDGNLAVFDGVTGKKIKDGGTPGIQPINPLPAAPTDINGIIQTLADMGAWQQPL